VSMGGLAQVSRLRYGRGVLIYEASLDTAARGYDRPPLTEP